MRLENKISIITGGANGIGRASGRLFAREGAAVGLIDIDADGGRAVEQALLEQGAKAKFVVADVSDADAIEVAIEQLVRHFNGLDILYNNAGGATARDDFILNMPLDEFEHAIGLNLFGPLAGCKFAIPHMRERGGGSIINTASIRSMIATRGADGYTAAKGGIVTLTRALALALQCGPMKIRVNAIAPGAVLTDRVKALMALGNDLGPDENLAQRHVLGMGDPEDVAPAALFFASDDPRWITGQVLPVDGGASVC